MPAPSCSQGILGGGDHCQFINLKIHDNGLTDFDHGIYYSSTGRIIEGCEIYRNAGWGVHVYSGAPDADQHANMIVRNNRVHDNARVGARGPGILLGAGSGHMAYNNVIWGNDCGIQVAYGGAADIKVFNNTVYGNAKSGIIVYDAVGTVVQNNIFFGNGGAAIDASPDGGTIVGNNLTDEDPAFVDPGAYDFRLSPGSPAIDAGEALGEVTVDIEGTPRPQGNGYDMGAYEAH